MRICGICDRRIWWWRRTRYGAGGQWVHHLKCWNAAKARRR